MRNYLMIVALITGSAAQAVTCTTDQDCFTASLSLIKKAKKLGACDAEAAALAGDVKLVASNGPTLQALEACVDKAAYDKKIEKRSIKRVQRIQKALDTSPKPTK